MDEQSQPEAEPLHQPPAAGPGPVGPDYWKRPKSRWLYLLILLVILALLAGAYWFLQKKKPAPTKPPVAASSIQQQSPSAITSKTSHYDSQNFQLSFNYPQDWQVTDTTGSGKLTVTSPDIQLKDASGQTVTGKVVMTIRDKTQKLSEFDHGNAVAVMDSKKIAYNNPTPTQRANTYISFLQYATSTSGLDGVYITGDNGYQKGQAIPLVDVSKSDPVISITFEKCTDSRCSSPQPISIQSSMWDANGFSGPLTTMLQSLSIT